MITLFEVLSNGPFYSSGIVFLILALASIASVFHLLLIDLLLAVARIYGFSIFRMNSGMVIPQRWTGRMQRFLVCSEIFDCVIFVRCI